MICEVNMERILRKPVLICLLAILAAFLSTAGAEREFPDCLRFTQTLTVKQLGRDRNQYITLPSTALPKVDREIEAAVKRLEMQARPHLTNRGVSPGIADRLDVGPYITRVGDRWMSFLTIGRVTHGHEQLFVGFEARVYNMETGRRVRLKEIIDEEKGGWDFLPGEVRKQLSAFFPSLEPDPSTLEALCAPEALKKRGFTLSPGHISLIFHAQEVYPDAPVGLLHVDIYYPELKPYMTETALQETDCTGYALVALTYDDGPRQGVSERLINKLQCYGGQVTYFLIGARMLDRKSIVHCEYDAGYSVQSHNWVHKYDSFTENDVQEWTERMDAEMTAIIGTGPEMMRSPGGKDIRYIHLGSPLPQIHWSVVSGDSNEDTMNNAESIVWHVAYAKDGDIVLCHDLRENAAACAERYLPILEKRNIMLVTVKDLCILRGVELKTGAIINNCPLPEE